MKIIKNTFPVILCIIIITPFNSCSKSVDFCVKLDASQYSVNATIYADASCSKNGDENLWEPQAGLLMIGNGTNTTESFLIQHLTGSLSRTIKLTISNSKSSRTQTKSVNVF